jgi:Fe-S cluster assembly protein SufD
MSAAASTETMQTLRERGGARFAELGWPTTRLEEWKYTSLAPVANTEWNTAQPGGLPDTSASLAGKAAVELIFHNGFFISRTGESRINVRNLAANGTGDEHLGRYAGLERNALVALNAAQFHDGAVIEIPADFVLDGFIHLLFVSSGEGIWSHPRNLIVAGRNSQVAIVETYAGSGRYFTNAVTEVVAGEGAVVDHSKITCESPDAFHTGTVQFQQGRSSSVTSRNISVGGALVRNDVNGVLSGEGANLVLDGLFVVRGNQHVDNHTLIDHVSPHCESHELYKGILDENGRGVFDGRIIVRPNAQKTISRQENRNLLLSESAIIDSKPTLEIHNDDVKCNHGSTIGQIDEEAMFYLRSRGIDGEEARNLLVHAFADQIVDRMKIDSVREHIRRMLFRQMPDRLPERRGKQR